MGLLDPPARLSKLVDVDSDSAVRGQTHTLKKTADGYEVVEAPGRRIPDIANSWWSYPDCVWDPIRRRLYVTGSTRGGAVKVAWFDLFANAYGEKILSEERHLADDHYTRALWLETVGEAGALGTAESRTPVIAGTYHDRTDDMRVHRFSSYAELDMPLGEEIVDFAGMDENSYGVLMGDRPDTNANSLAMIFRADSEYTAIVRSDDWGATWGTPYRLHTKSYTMVRRSAGNNVHILAIDHPTDATVGCRYYKNALTSAGGSFRNAAGAGINTSGVTGGFWTATAADLATPLVANASMDVVRNAPSGESQRIFDMDRDGNMIAIGTFADKTDLAAGCTYKILVRQTGATTNTWAEETLTTSGDAFGPSGYVGGVCFADGTDSTAGTGVVFLIREDDSTWTVERWVRTGTAFGSGTWELDEVVYTAPDGKKLGRPRCGLDLSDRSFASGLVTFSEYHRYDPDSFLDFYADQVLVEF